MSRKLLQCDFEFTFRARVTPTANDFLMMQGAELFERTLDCELNRISRSILQPESARPAPNTRPGNPSEQSVETVYLLARLQIVRNATISQ